jgi:hypothetical protein
VSVTGAPRQRSVKDGDPLFPIPFEVQTNLAQETLHFRTNELSVTAGRSSMAVKETESIGVFEEETDIATFQIAAQHQSASTSSHSCSLCFLHKP